MRRTGTQAGLAGAAFALLLCTASNVPAQGYPGRPIRLVVGFPPDGAAAPVTPDATEKRFPLERERFDKRRRPREALFNSR